MNLDFRKKLTEYGVTIEEYNNMTEEQKAEINRKINAELKANKFKTIGEGVQGCGCILMLLPILGILLLFIWILITS